MAREMPARAMRLGPSPRAVRHPPRCALDVYTRHGLWWLPRGNDMRQIVSITLCARCKAGPPSSVRGACLMPRIAGPRASMARPSALAAHACFPALYQSPSSVTVLPFVCSSTPGSSWGARAPMGTHIAVFQHDLVYIQRYSPSLPWTIIYIVDTWSLDVYQ